MKSTKRTNRWTWRVVALPVMVIACSSGESATAGRGARGQRGRTGAESATPVEVARVTTGSLANTATVSGALAPIRDVGVNAQLSGALLSVRVEEGSRVQAGDVMAVVDSRELAAQIRSAEASLALAKSTAERSARLWQERIITEVEHERDQAALASAQASVDALRTRLGYATVRAPIAGVVTEKRVEAGDLVQPQTRLFTVADVSTLVARVQVSELDITGVRAGDAADVTVDALGGAWVRGVVRRVFPAADTATRMVPVEVALSGPEARRLKPGFLARATFRLGERAGAVLAPATAVVGSGDARAVFVVKEERAERRPVRLGVASGGRVEVLEGLAAGETVVTAGAEGLRDGAAVRVVRPAGVPPLEAARPAPPGAAAGMAP
ncbi:MAG TPA: efflux RND transporter periplasmic adaptor subunit [Gemmatimonadaceae bacterium]|nr:efflux RND transporter periplasmic adaptor subunit [Gemmatimonadaceae bacterium]